MIAASVLGLPAIFLLITVLPCIRMGHEPGAAKYRRSQLGGILIILLGKARRGLLRFGMVRCVSREGKIYGQWVLLLWDISEEAAGPWGRGAEPCASCQPCPWDFFPSAGPAEEIVLCSSACEAHCPQHGTCVFLRPRHTSHRLRGLVFTRLLGRGGGRGRVASLCGSAARRQPALTSPRSSFFCFS